MKLGGDEAGAGRGLAAGPSAPCPSRPFWAAAWQTSVWDLPEPVAQDQVCADKRPRGFQVWVGGWRTPAAQAESSAAHYVRCCWSTASRVRAACGCFAFIASASSAETDTPRKLQILKRGLALNKKLDHPQFKSLSSQ